MDGWACQGIAERRWGRSGSLALKRSSVRPLEIFVKPGDGAANGVDLILAFCEAVAFVGVVMRVDDLAVFLKDFDDLLGFFLRDARIVAALEDQKRGLDIVNVGDGRGRLIDGAILDGITEKALLI